MLSASSIRRSVAKWSVIDILGQLNVSKNGSFYLISLIYTDFYMMKATSRYGTKVSQLRYSGNRFMLSAGVPVTGCFASRCVLTRRGVCWWI